MKLLSFLALLTTIIVSAGQAQVNPSPTPATPKLAAPTGRRLLSDSDYAKIIKCVVRDRAGNLWIATTWAGVFRTDGDTFTHFSAKDGLASDCVNTIYEDKNGVLWFGTDKGVTRYEHGTFSNFPLHAAESGQALFGRPPKPESPANYVASISQDRAGNLWFGIWGPPGSAGAYRFDGQRLTRFLPEKPIQGIIGDAAGGVWLNSTRYDGQSLIDLSGQANAFKEAVVCSLQDREGNLWFGVRSAGLYRYDGKAFTYFSETAGAFGRTTCLFQDRTGRLWLGGDVRFGTEAGGLSYYDGKSFVPVPQVFDFGLYGVWAAAEDPRGNLWFAGRGGKLLRYDGKTFTDFSAALNAAAQ